MEVSPLKTIEVGSAAWIGTDEYEAEGEFDIRARKFLADTKWDSLTRICSEHRQGVPCHLAEKFSIGHFNMVRQVVFEDNKLWVARLRMPDLTTDSEFSYSTLKQTVLSEVASMKLLKEKTSIPVPEVYAYDVDSNDVGAPYILMEYIPGTVASVLSQGIDAPPYQFGTIEQDQSFRRHMAAIQVELASLEFDQIGSIYQDPTTEQFYVGPDSQTGQGPWSSSIDYYDCLAQKSLKNAAREAPAEVTEDYSFSLPALFRQLFPLYCDQSSIQGPFSVVHQDFGAHNILVDENFKILAVIDFDGLISGPIEAQAQFPRLTGLRIEPPFQVETSPFVIKRIERTKPRLEEYKCMVQSCEGEARQSAQSSQSWAGDLMQSHTAAIVAGLEEYDMHQAFVNQKWMLSFARLLRVKVRQDE